jgi:drug/metabolite transporter (DMT)-like permease
VLGHPQTVSAASALFATFAWGVSDFVGGYASRRTNAFLFTTITHASGTSLMLLLALRSNAPFPQTHGVIWAAIAGLFGGFALAIFYRALSQGSMGLTAPVAAVLGAAIPTIVSIATEGMPGPIPLTGFVLAGIGIWLISRTEEGVEAKSAAIGVAVICGIGFAGYYLSIRQAGAGSIFWLAAISRCVSFFVTGGIVLAARQFRPIDRSGIAWGIAAGVLDISGSAMFIQATQMGRLDSSVVISSLYPAITVLLARVFLKEHFTPWRLAGLAAALAAVPMIAFVTAP